MAEDSSGWRARARAWAEHWPRLSEPARLAVADAVGLGAGVRVLDAGCGAGEFCALAFARGAQVSGIDVAEGMLALARERAPDADLSVGDIARLPWADDAFDVVTAFNAVQFTDDVPATIAELARVAARVAICNWREGGLPPGSSTRPRTCRRRPCRPSTASGAGVTARRASEHTFA